MPRNYVRKTLRATCYTPDDLVNAIHRVENKELSMYAASKEYNIPVATLHNRIYQKTGIKSSTLGRPTALPYETEVKLANGLTVLEKWGFGLSRKEVLSLVEEFVRMNNISTSFKDAIPGPDWFTNFRKRHKLSLKKAQPLEHIRRKNTDPFIVDEYFNLLKSTIQKLNLEIRQDSVLQSFEGPKNPATLSELCLNVICRKTSYDTNLNIEEIQPWLLRVQNSETVHLLKDLSKREEHALPFIAERANDLPTCLFSKEFSNENISTFKTSSLITKPNINVTSNILINYPHSFEDLLLQRVQQSPRSNNNTKKKRVALGAEVITETMRKDFMNNKTRAVLQTEIVPKKKLKINKISKIPKEINIINQTAAIYDGETSQIRKNITKKDRIKKENQQKKTLKKRKNAKLRTKLTQYSDTDSSSSETQFKIVSTDDSDYENLGEFIESCLREQEDDQEYIESVANLPPYGLSDLVFYEDSLLQLKEDNWLVVQFATKKSIKHFVGTVLSVEDEMPVIKFVRKVKQSKSELATTFSYPIVDDVCTVINKDIICVLPQPIISRRGQLIFNVDLSNYNIQ